MSENPVALREEITETKVVEYLDSAGITSTLLENEKKMFVNIAREFGLNPFKREIYIVAYGEGEKRKCSIITGYEVYLKRAERTGKLDGWNIKYEGIGENMKAIITIYRKDMKYPFSHEVYYSECVQYNQYGKPNAVWAKMPRFMTKKVAIGQAFRLCFPDDLGGMPYEEEEMPHEELKDATEKTPIFLPHDDATPQNDNEVVQYEGGKEEIGREIEEILETKDGDDFRYFRDLEAKQERDKFAAGDLQAAEKQLERLKGYLETRKAKRKPIDKGNTSKDKGSQNYDSTDDIPF
jgi:phage recombination protein Bet